MQWQSKRGKRLWAATSSRSRILMFLAILFTASALAVLLDVPRPIHPPVVYLVAYVALFGIMAVVFGLATVLDLRLMVVGIALNVIDVMVGSWATQAVGATPVSAAAEHRHLLGDTIACFVCIVLGYFFFVRAIHAMARRHSVLNAEVTLAKRIHEALVPVVSGRSGRADYYGRSHASGAIGGDLVDVIDGAAGTTLYVVDVSGHGVAAGVLMAMLKSTARTALAEGASLTALLAHLNRRVCELGRPGTFATCALLHLNDEGGIHYALAGHLPILRRRASSLEISELGVGGPPLGFAESERYESTFVDAEAGDEFLIITDGLTEVFRRDGREFGMDGVCVAFHGGSGSPKELTERVLAGAARYGRQLDDQTVLAVRLAAD